MIDPNNPEAFDDIMETLSGILSKQGVISRIKDSSDSDLEGLIKDHIYSLLTKETLSASEIDMLQALLQTVRIDLRG